MRAARAKPRWTEEERYAAEHVLELPGTDTERMQIRPRLGFRIFNAIMALLFVASAVLQYNDPDPVRWIALYAAAALGCLLIAPRLLFWWRIALAGAALGWGVMLLTQIIGRPFPPLADLFLHMEMRGGAVELTREAIGLGIVGLYMFWLAMTQR